MFILHVFTYYYLLLSLGITALNELTEQGEVSAPVLEELNNITISHNKEPFSIHIHHNLEPPRQASLERNLI